MFYFPVDICAPSFLPECRAPGSLSAPLFRSSQSPTWTYRGLLGGSCVISDKPISFPVRFFCWFRLPFLFSSSPLPSLNTARPQLVHLPLQHCCTHPPAPYSVTGPVHTRRPNGLVASAPQNLLAPFLCVLGLPGTAAGWAWGGSVSGKLGVVGSGPGLGFTFQVHTVPPRAVGATRRTRCSTAKGGTQSAPLSHMGRPARVPACPHTHMSCWAGLTTYPGDGHDHLREEQRN